MWGLASDPGKTGADGARMGGERGVGLEREGRALAAAPPAGPVGVRGYQPRLWSKWSSGTGSGLHESVGGPWLPLNRLLWLGDTSPDLPWVFAT